MTYSTLLRGTTATKRRSSQRALLPQKHHLQINPHTKRQPRLLWKCSRSHLPSIWLTIRPHLKEENDKENFSQKGKGRPLQAKRECKIKRKSCDVQLFVFLGTSIPVKRWFWISWERPTFRLARLAVSPNRLERPTSPGRTCKSIWVTLITWSL